MTRVLAFSALLCLTACDVEKSDDAASTTAGDTGTTGDPGAVTGAESSGSSSDTGEEVVEDFGRAGAVCDEVGAAAACQAGGVAGREFCFKTPFLDANGFPLADQGTWSACLTENCAAEHDERACDGAGTSYCVAHDVDGAVDLRWGVCNQAVACALGDLLECPMFDPYPCVRDGEGKQGWSLPDGECGFTPLVLSFGAALEFAAAPASAADFSLRGPDSCARADWPAAATPWLALDRDGNGAIDDGSELFGSGSRLASGSWARDGFIALAELDSDGDRAITPADARWSELVLWADHDGDRRSSGWELLPLASFAVEAVELDYGRASDCDARGNCGFERAGFRYRSGGRSLRGEVIDVHLACE